MVVWDGNRRRLRVFCVGSSRSCFVGKGLPDILDKFEGMGSI